MRNAFKCSPTEWPPNCKRDRVRWFFRRISESWLRMETKMNNSNTILNQPNCVKTSSNDIANKREKKKKNYSEQKLTNRIHMTSYNVVFLRCTCMICNNWNMIPKETRVVTLTTVIIPSNGRKLRILTDIYVMKRNTYRISYATNAQRNKQKLKMRHIIK